jgi:uncharacterized protein YndB with AHSA1/START domain
MKLLGIIVATLAGLVLIVVVVGYLLPERHRASRERTFATAPETVYAAVTSVAEYPAWRRGVERVEMLAEAGGRPRFREVGSNGSITYVIDELQPPSRVVSRIADESLPFGGRWTYELMPSPTGTRLRITEDGEVYNPIFRFVSRFIIGHHRTMDTYLDDLDRRLRG